MKIFIYILVLFSIQNLYSQDFLDTKRLLNIKNDNDTILKLGNHQYLSFSGEKVVKHIVIREVVETEKINKKNKRSVRENIYALLEVNQDSLSIYKDKEGREYTLEVQDGKKYIVSFITKSNVVNRFSYNPKYVGEEAVNNNSREAFMLAYENLKSVFYEDKFYELKKTDTIYIYFDYNNNTNLKTYDWGYFKDGKTNIQPVNIYQFIFNKYYNIEFVQSEYRNIDLDSAPIKMDRRIVNKTFLKKNKSKIIDIDFFIKNGYEDVYLAIMNKKIYVIDDEEITNNKITLKEVYINYLF